MSQFSELVYSVVEQIPKGRVATYGQIARLIGKPRSSRVVGYALHRNPKPGIIPCHRVVFKDGALAPGFAFGGSEAQRELLLSEGVVFTDKGTVDLETCLWEVLVRTRFRTLHKPYELAYRTSGSCDKATRLVRYTNASGSTRFKSKAITTQVLA